MMIHLKRNWPAKLLSLLAAIVMWFFIMRDQNPVMEVTYTVPVQVQNLNSGYIVEDAPDTVRVVLAGLVIRLFLMSQIIFESYI